MDFALVEDKSAYRRHHRFIWSTLDSLVRSRAIDDSIRTDVFLAIECRADVEGTLGGYPEVLLRYGFKLSWGSIDARKSFLEEIDTTMYTPQMCNLIWNEFALYDKAIHFRNALLKKRFYKHVKNSRLNIPTNRKLQKHFRTYVTYIKQRDRTKKSMSDKDLQYFFMALPADIQTSFKSHCTKYCSAFRDFINQTMVTMHSICLEWSKLPIVPYEIMRLWVGMRTRTRRIMRGMRTRRIMRLRVSSGMRTMRLVQRLIRLVWKLIKRLIQRMSNIRAGV